MFEVLAELVEEFGPPNREFLARRAAVQQQIDDYYREKRRSGWEPTEQSAARDAGELESLLVEIGYLAAERAVDFAVATPQLDPEMDRTSRMVPQSPTQHGAEGPTLAGALYDALLLAYHSGIDAESRVPPGSGWSWRDQRSSKHLAPWQGGVGFASIEARRPQGRRRIPSSGRSADGRGRQRNTRQVHRL